MNDAERLTLYRRAGVLTRRLLELGDTPPPIPGGLTLEGIRDVVRAQEIALRHVHRVEVPGA